MKNNAVKWDFVRGILAAQTAIAAVTGKQTMDGMTDREWKLISYIHLALAELSSGAVRDWENG